MLHLKVIEFENIGVSLVYISFVNVIDVERIPSLKSKRKSYKMSDRSPCN